MRGGKLLSIALAALLLLACLGGCGAQRGTSAEAVYETYDFDLGAAAEMIDETEWLIAWLQAQDSITRSEADALIARLNETLDYEGENVVTVALADAADWEDETLQALPVGNGYLSPTVYHAGVSIVSATEERYDVPESYRAFLHIRKEYAGGEPGLRGWYLEYVFARSGADEPWRFGSWNGTYNAEAALPLKAAFYETEYKI